MLCVSCSLFCFSRVISSWMLTAEPEGTCFSSSILASSSAIGCSKSRKFTAIGARGYRGHSSFPRKRGSASPEARPLFLGNEECPHSYPYDEAVEAGGGL